jgi:hypothetical protein
MDWIDLAQDREWWKAHEDGNEQSNSIKRWEILEWLPNWWLIKKRSATWN